MTPKIKICGLTSKREAFMLNKSKVEYAGMILFYEKSKRYNTIQKTWEILRCLKPDIKKVAVTVSPTPDQLSMIEHLGFDILQVHGELTEEVMRAGSIPIWRAYNITGDSVRQSGDTDSRIEGYVLDGGQPGTGLTFDWQAMKSFQRREKLLILAGGLAPENVREGIKELAPDVVDVSSGVEGSAGKDEDRIKEFVRRVRENEQ